MSVQSFRLLIWGAGSLVLVGLVAALFFVQNPSVQGGIMGGLIGLISAQGSLLVERWLRERGEVRCDISGWRVEHLIPQPGGGYQYVESPGDVRFADTAECYFRATFYNHKDIDIGLRDPFVTLFWEEATSREYTPLKTYSDRPVNEMPILHLPSHRFIVVDMMFRLDDEDRERISEVEGAELKAYLPDGDMFEQKIPLLGSASL